MAESTESKGADRTLAIFEAFEQLRRPLTLRELADHCGIPASTCHGLVHTLIARAYLYQTSRRKDIYPTRRIFDLAATVVAHDPVIERVSPVLEQLRRETQETVLFGKRHKDQILYLEVLEGPQTIRYSSRPGAYKPMHSSAIGKVMLAAMDPAELDAWLQEHPLPRVTPATITNRKRLIESLEEGRRLGYFSTHGENVPDVSAIAVPIHVGGELLAICVAGPSHRMQGSTLRKHTSHLLDARRRLQEQGIAA